MFGLSFRENDLDHLVNEVFKFLFGYDSTCIRAILQKCSGGWAVLDCDKLSPPC